MSQLSLEDLANLPKGFDPAKAPKPAGKSHGFETKEAATNEDGYRALFLLMAYGLLFGESVRKAILSLAERLDEHATPVTCASSRYMRERRRVVIGHLWRLFAQAAGLTCGTVTVMVRGWQFEPRELHRVDPRRLLEQFRADLNRCGLSKTDGFAFFGLHGEYNSLTGKFDLHIHGVYAGGIGDVLQALRKRPKYRPVVIEHEGARKKVNRVKVSTRPMENMPYPITYVLQSWWPRRDTFIDGEKGKMKRSSRKRIPHSPHARWLLWMDRWTVSDLTLMVRMRVTKKGLVRAEKRTRINRKTVRI